MLSIRSIALHCIPLAAASAFFLAPADSSPTPPSNDLDNLIHRLDANGDGMIEPFEAADVILGITKSKEGIGLSPKDFRTAISEIAIGRLEEAKEMFKEFDRNQDGRVQLREIPPRFRVFAKSADRDQNGWLTLKELASIRVNAQAMARAEAAEAFEDLDRNTDGRLAKNEIPKELGSELATADKDHDGFLTPGELEAHLVNQNGSARFEVSGSSATMRGVIDATTPGRVLQLIVEHPEVRTILMPDVPGSMDDESNLRAAELIHQHGFTTIVPAAGVIASGGVDFFLAGTTRRVAPDGKLGVHSWDGPEGGGSSLPKNHPGHQMFLDFYPKIGISNDFYWYTLRAAPPEGVHWMSRDEMKKYGVESEAKK